MDHSRDPCPWVIINDFGGAFSMGVSFDPPEELLAVELTFARPSEVLYGTV
jgi:hypothetical protein